MGRNKGNRREITFKLVDGLRGATVGKVFVKPEDAVNGKVTLTVDESDLPAIKQCVEDQPEMIAIAKRRYEQSVRDELAKYFGRFQEESAKDIPLNKGGLHEDEYAVFLRHYKKPTGYFQDFTGRPLRPIYDLKISDEVLPPEQTDSDRKSEMMFTHITKTLLDELREQKSESDSSQVSDAKPKRGRPAKQ